MERVSVIIPAFRESEFLDRILKDLSTDKYPNKEVIVVIDEPTEKSKHLKKKYKNFKFMMNSHRVGKANALNSAVSKSRGDIIFFLDSDVRITSNPKNIVSGMLSDMKGMDIGEVVLDTAVDSFLSKMVDIELVNYNMINKMYSKLAGKKPAIAGVGFAIRREAFLKIGGFGKYITEDVDIGWRSFVNNFSYCQIRSVRVDTFVKKTVRDWLTQRNRWVVGIAEWVTKNTVSIMLNSFKQMPHIGVASILMFFPIVLIAPIGALIPDSVIEQTMMSANFPQTALPAASAFSDTSLSKGVLMYALGFVISMGLTYASFRSFGRKFRVPEFLFYYFVYSPLMMAMLAYAFVRVGIFRNTKLSDWKV